MREFVLKHEPNLAQLRLEMTAEEFAYREEELPFFLTHLVALVAGLDPRLAEGRRRIRRLLLELGETGSTDYIGERAMIREKGGVFEKPLSKRQRERLRESLDHMQALDDSQPDACFGALLDGALEKQAFLPDRVEWVHRQLPILSRLNSFRYLQRIGHPVIVPDSRFQTVLLRLGLLEETGSSRRRQLDACRLGENVARSLKCSAGELDFQVHVFAGAIDQAAPQAAVCGPEPHCERCDLTPYCQFYRINSKALGGGEEGAAVKPLSLKQWRPNERPRERLMQRGASALEDSELLAIVLRTGTGKINVIEMSRMLLDKFGSLDGIADASLQELQTVRGIGKMKAVEIKAAFELGRRQTFRPLLIGDTITCSDDVYKAYRGRFANMRQEEFLVLMLDNKARVTNEEVVSRGGLDSSIVHPREVFKAAIRASAASVIFVHNHPSGDPSPSHDDFVVTQRLEEAAELLQIKMLDHVIVGAGQFYSFTDGETVTVDV
ncbi:MAG: RadC family protein [Candidatus Sumerlaeota bacterium]